MKVVIQRVKDASVVIDGNLVSSINRGLLVFLGISESDTGEEIAYLSKKICEMRIFEDEKKKMNLSLLDIGGEILLVSQFTLYANCKNGRRPDFTKAAKPDIANKLYELFAKKLEEFNVSVKKGIFGADMKVSLLNDGPVTIVLEHNNK